MSVTVATALLLTAVSAQAGAGAQLPPSTPEGRRAVQTIGHCVAERSPEAAAAMLNRDFTTRAYVSQFDRLLRTNASCLGDVEHMASSRLLLAGAIAEALVERETIPLNVRLARAALQPAIPARSPSDAIAICATRSLPDDVAVLFSTEVASEAEAAAARAIEPVVARCNATGAQLETTEAGLRAVLATAAFRSVHRQRPTREARN